MKGQLFRLPLLPVLEKQCTPTSTGRASYCGRLSRRGTNCEFRSSTRAQGLGGTMTRELHVYNHASAMIALLFVSPNGTVEAFDVEGFNRIGEFASVADAAAFACADVEMPCLDS